MAEGAEKMKIFKDMFDSFYDLNEQKIIRWIESNTYADSYPDYDYFLDDYEVVNNLTIGNFIDLLFQFRHDFDDQFTDRLEQLYNELVRTLKDES